ncbi:MAG: hypothetical protein E7068_03035 [Lentimicrobiaceae bacterium]|nr:hypothetical protein [Lentimicrobiaceae bacterium]MBQ4548912.1 hypothetical protein [Bacteroidales bacterium]MBR2051383.1 hypothetical protein [Bacteroidales bacterium]
MKKKKQNITDIFVRGRKLTLGIKLVGTFAFTYYLLYFVLLTVFGIYYRSVYNPAYSGETLFQTMLMSAILWFIVGMLVVSLILLFRRRRYGKFLFMIFTVILLIYQFVTAENHVWAIYFLELMIVLVMAPLKVFVNINKNIIEKMTDISNVEE